MTRADAAQEIAAYLAGPAPEDAMADLRDLGVIGFANELPGITPQTMRTLIAGAPKRSQLGRYRPTARYDCKRSRTHLPQAQRARSIRTASRLASCRRGRFGRSRCRNRSC